MTFLKKEHKNFKKNTYKSYILGGDIGGTNTNLGVFGVKNNNPTLLISFHFKSKELSGLHEAVNEALDYMWNKYKIKITKACFGIAGIPSTKMDYVKITNINWNVNKKILIKNTKLKNILFINDFQAIGYGINMLNKNDVITIKRVKKVPKAPVIVVGAGTGLGKSTLMYNEGYKSYIPIHSEAGHSDFPAQNEFELKLIEFIKKHHKIKENVPYELLLSGRGLSNIYLFLRNQQNRQNQRFCGPENLKIFSESKIFVATKIQKIFAGTKKFKETKYTKEIDKSKNQPELISKYRKIDKTCKAVFEIFKKIYARFAKNYALDALALGGVYIAGGIAPKNKDIFDRIFVKEFEKNYKQGYILKKIPIYLITNYDVGLLGAGFACAKFL